MSSRWTGRSKKGSPGPPNPLAAIALSDPMTGPMVIFLLIAVYYMMRVPAEQARIN